MKIAIAQPTYLPWLGCFDLLNQVDKFVLLDTLQFEKQSWQQRNDQDSDSTWDEPQIFFVTNRVPRWAVRSSAFSLRTPGNPMPAP